MNDYSKKTSKEIKRLAKLAHERELEKALSNLNSKFKQWENKGLDSFELDKEIHKYYNKTSKEIFKKYNSNDLIDYFVAIAVVNNIIKKDEIKETAYQDLELLIEKIKFRVEH